MKKLLFRRGFTDKLYFYNLWFAWLFTVSCFILTAFSGEAWLNIGDLSVLSTGLQAVWTELPIFISSRSVSTSIRNSFAAILHGTLILFIALYILFVLLFLVRW